MRQLRLIPSVLRKNGLDVGEQDRKLHKPV